MNKLYLSFIERYVVVQLIQCHQTKTFLIGEREVSEKLIPGITTLLQQHKLTIMDLDGIYYVPMASQWNASRLLNVFVKVCWCKVPVFWWDVKNDNKLPIDIQEHNKFIDNLDSFVPLKLPFMLKPIYKGKCL